MQTQTATSQLCKKCGLRVATPCEAEVAMIYVMQVDGHRFIKIGYTADKDLTARITTLQTGCPYEIFPVMTVDGSLSEERSLHIELADALARLNLPSPPNEWYPGKHFFVRLVLAELRYGARTAIEFIRAYIATKRGNEQATKQPRTTWTPAKEKKPVVDDAFQHKQIKVVRGLPNGSSASLLRKRAEDQERANLYRKDSRKQAQAGQSQAPAFGHSGLRSGASSQHPETWTAASHETDRPRLELPGPGRRGD